MYKLLNFRNCKGNIIQKSIHINNNLKMIFTKNKMNCVNEKNNSAFNKFRICGFSSSDGPFPKFDKKDFYDENDLIINIGEKETFKGMLVICPTPIGNLNDISIRQYEALRNGDILACEDTRKTGKLLELVQLKKMKEKFYSEFGISFEEFLSRGGMDMNDEQIKKAFFKNKNNPEEESKNKSQDENNLNNENNENENTNHKEEELNSETNSESIKANPFKENYNSFYESEQDVKKYKKFSDRLDKYEEKLNAQNAQSSQNIQNSQNNQQNENPSSQGTNSKSIYNKLKPKNNSLDITNEDSFFNKLKKRVDIKLQKTDPFNQIDQIVKEVNLNYSEEDPKNFIDQLKKSVDEPVTKDYYSAVKDSEDFLIKKTIIENSSEDLKEFIEPLAESYEDNKSLSYKLRTKAKFMMGMLKKYNKKKKGDENDEEEEESRSKEEILEEEMTLNSGLEDNLFSTFKRKIKEEKEKKGRGILVPFNEQNEEAKIPKLIRAMKMGLRIVLVSDAGTPTISDPGYKLVKEAAKNGIIIEPLPGASAVITALSACALPTDKFVFIGYLPKNPNDKVQKLEEIKRIGYTTVLFESPHRIKRSIETMAEVLGPKQEVYLGLELTKKFETHMYGSLDTIKDNLALKEDVKGEITIIVAPYKDENQTNEKELNDAVKLEALDFARKVDKVLNLSDKDMRNLLTEVCDISSIKASKIINTIKHRESSITKFLKQTKSRIDKLDVKSPEDDLREQTLPEASIKKIPKIIKRNREKNDKNENRE